MEAILEATARDTFGKNEARRTRREGRVPAVLYGASTDGASREATPIAVEPKALLRILHSDSGANTIISLKLAGGSDAKVLVKEYQLDPVTHAVLHADFYRVAMDRLLQVTIPIVVKGEPKGVKQQGGILEFVRREDRNRMPASGYSRTYRRRRQRADAASRRSRARHRHQSEVEAAQRRRHDARPRHHAEG
jgi:large subunit ribosomal protein L25